MAGAKEKKAAIATCKEGEMAALIESITSLNTKKSTAIVQHSL